VEGSEGPATWALSIERSSRCCSTTVNLARFSFAESAIRASAYMHEHMHGQRVEACGVTSSSMSSHKCRLFQGRNGKRRIWRISGDSDPNRPSHTCHKTVLLHSLDSNLGSVLQKHAQARRPTSVSAILFVSFASAAGGASENVRWWRPKGISLARGDFNDVAATTSQ